MENNTAKYLRGLSDDNERSMAIDKMISSGGLPNTAGIPLAENIKLAIIGNDLKALEAALTMAGREYNHITKSHTIEKSEGINQQRNPPNEPSNQIIL